MWANGSGCLTQPSIDSDASIPLVSSTSAVAVSGTLRDGAGGSGWRRPPISILVTSESMTDAITYHMSPNARIMSSSSTTGIYTPDDDECPHDEFDYPQSPTPSLTSFGVDAARRIDLQRFLAEENRDVFADTPSSKNNVRGSPSNSDTRAAHPLPASNADNTAVRPTCPAPPTATLHQASAPPTPFPNLLRLLLFMPWCIAVGATITLFPAHIDRVVFSTGYIPGPAPRGVHRFGFWADTARDYACIFGFALLSLFAVSAPAAWVACALALARFVWVWGAYACARGERCCCVHTHTSERLGEDDMESLALIARGGDMANMVLRQCADHSGARSSRPGVVEPVAVARSPVMPQK